MVRACGLALLMLSLTAPANAAPAPLQQLDFPVLAVGDTGQFRLRLGAHPAGQVVYSAHALSGADPVGQGYRFVGVACPSGFHANVHHEDRGVVCFRTAGPAHPPLEMVVTVYNEGAADGATRKEDGLWVIDAQGTKVTSAWHLFGVRP
ncbi:hypothetical protein [Stenotrophomonas sp.]|uniref:hypothetical protein n=1 Tax=Stenotrophomonas sp. TaxID=69392 RepID=UPI002FC5D766